MNRSLDQKQIGLDTGAKKISDYRQAPLVAYLVGSRCKHRAIAALTFSANVEREMVIYVTPFLTTECKSLLNRLYIMVIFFRIAYSLMKYKLWFTLDHTKLKNISTSY